MTTWKPRRRRWIAFVILVLACAVLAAGAWGRPAVRAGDVQHLTWGIGASIRGLEYTHSADSGTATVVSLGCETLVKYDRLGRLVPALADHFGGPNILTRTYRIRKNVHFWDGTTLTPADVVYSLQRAASSKAGSQIAAFYTSVKSITAQGDRVVVKLKQPDPYFKYAVAVTYILEKKYWQAHLKTIGTPQAIPVCTGPFQFTSFKGDEDIELKAFDGYWGGRPKVRAISLKVIINDATRLLAMRSGELDGTFRISQDAIDQWKQLPGVSIQLAPELRTAYLSLDTEDGPLSDVHVRRAIAYSFDRAGLVKAVLHGYGQTAPTMPPPEQWGNLQTVAQAKAFNASLPQYSYSLAKAKAELAKSSQYAQGGFSLTLPFPDAEATLGKAALQLSQSLKKLNINLTVKEQPVDQWFATIYAHKNPLGLQIISWGVDYPDPADALHFIYDSKGAVANNFNTANYKSPQMDALLLRQQDARTPAARVAALKQAFRLAAADVPYIPIWYQEIAMAVSNKFNYAGFGTWYLYTPWALQISAK
jgi:peptide/nickel transport system substrate-binding protein